MEELKEMETLRIPEGEREGERGGRRKRKVEGGRKER